MARTADTDLVVREALAHIARASGFAADFKADRFGGRDEGGARGVLFLGKGRARHRFAAIVRPFASRADIAACGGRPERPVLMARYVNPALADAYHEAGIGFADTAGNLLLKDEHLLIFVKGNRQTDTGRQRAPRRRPGNSRSDSLLDISDKISSV